MQILLILLIMGAAGAVLFAVVRGLHAFANMRPGELGEDGIPVSLTKQNNAMFTRIKWQAIAIILMVLLLVLAKSN